MKKDKSDSDDMLPEYSFKGTLRGEYAKRYAEGTNVVLLDPDVHRVFRTSEAVNEALRGIIQVYEKAQPKKRSALGKGTAAARRSKA